MRRAFRIATELNLYWKECETGYLVCASSGLMADMPAGGWAVVQDEAARQVSRIVQATGDRSVAIGGNVSGRTIITGDHNKVE